MQESAELHVNLLGPPQIAWRGVSFEAPRRQVRALLYYLAQTTEPAPRDRIAFLFWPDLPDQDARANLKRLLSTLRSALPERSLLQAGRDHVGLDWERSWCDAMAFQRLAAAPDSISWAQAVALYRSSFLDGFFLPDCPEYDEWQGQTRLRLEHRYLAALSGLIDARRACGDLAAAAACAQRYLAVERARSLRQVQDLLING